MPFYSSYSLTIMDEYIEIFMSDSNSMPVKLNQIGKNPANLLVEVRRIFDDATTMFVTISPNPNRMHSVQRISDRGRKCKVNLKYCMLKHDEQYNYLMEYIRKVYNPWLTDASMIWTFELNGAGNLHVHMLVKDRFIKNDYDLNVFRRNVMNETETLFNMVKSKNPRDYMNNIVYVTKPIEEVVDYLFKDYEQSCDHFPGWSNF